MATNPSQRLALRQGPSLTLTPQLLQSIGLLQLSHLELCAFLEAEMERNPLLGEAEPAVVRPAPAQGKPPGEGGGLFLPFPPARRRDAAMARSASLSGAGAAPDPEAAQGPTLARHLEEQIALAAADPVRRAIARHLAHSLDEAGYLRDDIEAVAERLGRSAGEVEAALALLQGLDPAGVGARSLSECLALQLKERGRLDGPMAILLDRLDLVAKGDLAALERLSGLDADGLRERLAAIRRLDPRPGLAFSPAAVDVLVPDVLVQEDPAGGFIVALNPETLPRIGLDRAGYARIRASARSEADRAFLSDCLRSARWLARTLDRRARTVLAVAAVIVRHQEAFLRQGPAHLRPLTLRTVAAEAGLHESTVSRVVAGKALGTPRGTRSMKFFFGAALSGDTGAGLSGRAVQHRIRRIVAAEEPGQALTDGAIARMLEAEGIAVARRTVAKYREALRIPPASLRRARAEERHPSR